MNSPPQKPARPASRSQRTPLQRAGNWLTLHKDCAFGSLKRLLGNPASSIMTLSVIGIALVLPALLYISGLNLSQFGDSLENTHRITAYLDGPGANSRASALAERLRSHALVAKVEIVSSDQASQDFRRWSGLGDIMASLEDNPLPASVVLTPVDTRAETAARLGDELRKDPDIMLVQLDQDWAERLENLLSLMQRAVWSLTIILALAVLFVVGNSINSLIADRDAEIRVMALIGASRAFIARPFLYTGLWYGLLGGVLAWLAVNALLLWLQGPATQLLTTYGEQYRFYGLHGMASLTLLAGSAMLGWAGARLSVSRHLRQHTWL